MCSTNRYGTIKHPKTALNKYVYIYKSANGLIYMSRDNNIIYYDTEEEAIKKGGNKCCWMVAKIKKCLGD